MGGLVPEVIFHPTCSASRGVDSFFPYKTFLSSKSRPVGKAKSFRKGRRQIGMFDIATNIGVNSQIGSYFGPVSIAFAILFSTLLFIATKRRIVLWARILLGLITTFVISVNLLLAAFVILALYFVLVDMDSHPGSHYGLYSYAILSSIGFFAYSNNVWLHGLGAGMAIGAIYSIVTSLFHQAKRDTLSLNEMGLKHPEDARALPRDRTRLADSEQKRIVYARYHGHCAICGRGEEHGVTFQYDHIIPWSKGGRTTVDNLMLLCAPCNQAKSDQMLEHFLAGKKNKRASR
jgi:hypothetical protein